MKNPYPKSSLFKCQPVQIAGNKLNTLRIELMNNPHQFNKYKELSRAWKEYNQLRKKFEEIR